eukprot:95820_1
MNGYYAGKTILWMSISLLSYIAAQSTECAQNGDCNVLCSGRICEWLTITAPLYGDLTVECPVGDIKGCDGLRVNGSHMINGTLTYKSSIARCPQSRNIFCPGNGNQCNIECTVGGCGCTTFHTQADSNLHVVSSGANALELTKIHCPLNGECTITTVGDAPSMLSSTMIYAVNGLRDLSLTCNYSTGIAYNCYDTMANPHLACKPDFSVRCNLELISGYDVWECVGHNATALCSDNTTNGYYGSEFMCDQSDKCNNRDLMCDDDGDCAAYCISGKVCTSSHITGPRNGNLLVRCKEDDGCMNTLITAPHSGDMDVECMEGIGFRWSQACASMKVNGTHMNGSLLYKSAVHTGVTTRNIYCPGNGNRCDIECAGTVGGCRYTTFHTQPDTNLHIVSSGADALRTSKVHCPLNGECTFTAVGDAPNMLSGAMIYAVNGLQDVSLTCNYSTGIANCYDIAYPHLACKPDFSVRCNLQLISGYDAWDCVPHSATALCSDNTTNGYYGSEFVCDQSDKCNNNKLRCDNDSDCAVYCYAQGGCQNSPIIGPPNGSLSVLCTSRYSCTNVAITAPFYGDLTVECKGDTKACGNLKVNGSHMITGGLSYKSSVSHSSHKYVYCPLNGNECNIYCILNAGCRVTNFYTAPDSQLHISVSSAGSNAMIHSTMYCPPTLSGCSLHTDSTGIATFAGDLSEISLSCNHSWIPNNDCFDASRVELLCAPPSNVSCSIGPRIPAPSGCINETSYSVCDPPTLDPTEFPSFDPSTAPTQSNPSKQPSSYEVSIEIIACDDQDGDDNTCHVSPDLVSELIATIESSVGSSEVVDHEIVDNELVVILRSDQELDSDVISAHIEAQIKENTLLKDEFGDAEVQRKDDDHDSDDDSDEALQTNISLDFGSMIVLGAIGGLLIFICLVLLYCCCCRKRKQEMQQTEERIQSACEGDTGPGTVPPIHTDGVLLPPPVPHDAVYVYNTPDGAEDDERGEEVEDESEEDLYEDGVQKHVTYGEKATRGGVEQEQAIEVNDESSEGQSAEDLYDNDLHRDEETAGGERGCGKCHKVLPVAEGKVTDGGVFYCYKCNLVRLD